ncbi:hypothetical protein HMPREF9429_00646 [Megasphaera micronuciformis F0359]|uniref:Uncharacterized protein n=1 Tax=Megasphaera micronuciformis F0359 TaxID=706434 RepID=E2ZB20_9FIRM|nr:hypothetical protein HMPREF9429_00646 [Megasphaera micronuciformis F0359]
MKRELIYILLQIFLKSFFLCIKNNKWGLKISYRVSWRHLINAKHKPPLTI